MCCLIHIPAVIAHEQKVLSAATQRLPCHILPQRTPWYPLLCCQCMPALQSTTYANPTPLDCSTGQAALHPPPHTHLNPPHPQLTGMQWRQKHAGRYKCHRSLAPLASAGLGKKAAPLHPCQGLHTQLQSQIKQSKLAPATHVLCSSSRGECRTIAVKQIQWMEVGR